MIEIIETQQYHQIETFAQSLGFQSFLQSEGWASVKSSPKLKIHGLLVKEDGVIIGAALLHQRVFKANISHFYAPRGLLVDFHQLDHVTQSLLAIKSFVKKKGGMFVTMDPEIIINHIDEQGNPMSQIDAWPIIDVFSAHGFIHRGFNKNFEALNPRYTFILELVKHENLLDSYHSTYRKLLRRPAPYLSIEKTDMKDMSTFVFLMEATAKREKFFSSGRNHYEHIYSLLQKRNMSDLYVVHLHVDKLKQSFTDQLNELETKLQAIDPKKYQNQQKYENRVNEIKVQLSKVQHLMESYAHLSEDDIIPLSSIMTVKYAQTVWTLHGGNHDDFKEFNAALHLYHRIFDDAKAEGYHYADLFGTTGEWDNPQNPVYGIYMFKKRFQGKYVEYIGEFTWTNQPMRAFIYRKVLPLATKIIRKLRK